MEKEDSKGNEVTKEAYKLLSKFQILLGMLKVVISLKEQLMLLFVMVCWKYIIKTAEGVADTIGKIIKKI